MKTLYILTYRYTQSAQFATEYFTIKNDAFMFFNQLVEDEKGQPHAWLEAEIVELTGHTKPLAYEIVRASADSGMVAKQVYTRAENGKTPEGTKEWETIQCDRCGRLFSAKHVYCLCRG